MSPGPRRLVCALVLVVVGIGPFVPTLAGTRLHFSDDLGQFSYPLRQYYADCLHRGTLPLWCPYLFAGYPVLADGQIGPFYPLNLVLFALLPTPMAFSWALALGVLTAAWGMYLYVSRLTRSTLAGLTSAAALVTSGFWVGHVVHLNLIQAAAMVPWAFYCLDRAWDGRTRWLVGVAGAIGIAALAGFPQVVQIMLLGLGAKALWNTLAKTSGGSARWRGAWFASAVAAMLVGLALGAAQLLPTYELLGRGQRSKGLTRKTAAQVHVPPRAALTYLVPHYFGWQPPGHPHAAQPYWAGGGAGQWESLCYVGAGVLALALAGGWPPWPTRHIPFFVLMFVVATLMSFGPATFLFDALYWIPGFRYLRAYARFLMLAHFSLAVLAGFGLAALASGVARVRVGSSAMVVLAGILIVVLVDPCGAGRPAGMAPVRWVDPTVWASALVCVALGLAAFVWPSGSTASRALAVGAMVLACAQAAGALWGFNRSVRTDVALAESPTARWLRQRGMQGRILVQSSRHQGTDVAEMNRCLGFNVPATYRLPCVSGYAPLGPLRIRMILTRVLGKRSGLTMPLAQRANLLHLLRVQALVATPSAAWPPYDLGPPTATFGSTAIYWFGPVGPEALLVGAVDELSHWQDALLFVWNGDTDLTRTACVEPATDALPTPLDDTSPPGTVRVVRSTDTELELDVHADRPALVVISRPWDPGWKAWLDGRSVPIHRTDYVVQGVYVSPNDRRLRLAYEPDDLFRGARISAGALIALVVCLLVSFRRRPASAVNG